MSSQIVLILISFFVSICFAGVGGTGGGSNPKAKGQLITVRVCDGGESGMECRTITYRERPKSQNSAPECYIYHGEMMLPCPTNYNRQSFMKNIMSNFVTKGYDTKILVQTL